MGGPHGATSGIILRTHPRVIRPSLSKEIPRKNRGASTTSEVERANERGRVSDGDEWCGRGRYGMVDSPRTDRISKVTLSCQKQGTPPHPTLPLSLSISLSAPDRQRERKRKEAGKQSILWRPKIPGFRPSLVWPLLGIFFFWHRPVPGVQPPSDYWGRGYLTDCFYRAVDDSWPRSHHPTLSCPCFSLLFLSQPHVIPSD